jgi:hypothetical protein
MFCPYQRVFGDVGKGIHSYRFLNIAYIDVILTFLLAAFLSYVFKWSFLWTIIGTFLSGIFFHRLFCVRTTIDKLIWP